MVHLSVSEQKGVYLFVRAPCIRRSVAVHVECSSDVYFILKVVVIVDVCMFLESVYTIFAYI